MANNNLITDLCDVKSGLLSSKRFKRNQQVSEDFIKNLYLEKELQGHSGCVNCLDWNETGELLASGSDDTRVIIWDPFSYKVRADIKTLHEGNIFSVKFLPKFNNQKIATASADFNVKLIDLSSEIVIENHICHFNRVKRLEVCYNEPSLLWSCSEDGTIRQFDVREPSCTQNNYQSPNVLINLRSIIGMNTELKCLSINPMRSHQIAVGCNDPYVRLYDRRKLSLKSHHKRKESIPRKNIPNNNGIITSSADTSGVVQYFVPGHIPLGTVSGYKCTTTHLTFSPDGDNLLVNMSGDQIYLYDINKVHPLTNFQTNVAQNVAKCNCDLYCDYSIFKSDSSIHSTMTPGMPINESICNLKDVYSDMTSFLNNLKEQGNQMYRHSDYHSAVKFYNTALKYKSNNPANFYANRAAAYIARNWIGDTYAALLDCIRVIETNVGHIKSHFRLAKCLYQLNMIAEAHDYIMYIKSLFPEHSKKIKEIEELKTKITDKISEFIVKENNDKSRKASSNRNSEPKGAKQDVWIDKASVTNLLETINKQTLSRRYLESKTYSAIELHFRTNASDYVNRYCGHCNTNTDIKEANFFGIDGRFIMAGSDDGNIFFWDRQTEKIVRVLKGDSNIVNCLQGHPSICMLATSGIDNVVRLWTPNSTQMAHSDDKMDCNTKSFEMNNIGEEQDELKTVKSNHDRLKAGPFEVLFFNIGLQRSIFGQTTSSDDDDNDDIGGNDNAVSRGAVSRASNQDDGRSRRINIRNYQYCRAS